MQLVAIEKSSILPQVTPVRAKIDITSKIRSKIKQLDMYAHAAQDKNHVALGEKICNIMCGQEAHKRLTYTIWQMIKVLCFLYKQKGDDPTRSIE